MIRVRRLEEAELLPSLASLRAEALAEGYRHIESLAEKWPAAGSTLGNAFFAAVMEGEIVGIGGITPDPYDPSPDLLRMRRFYVRPAFRKAGVGRRLADASFAWGRPRGTRLSVLAPGRAAALFWEALGFRPDQGRDRTHLKRL